MLRVKENRYLPQKYKPPVSGVSCCAELLLGYKQPNHTISQALKCPSFPIVEVFRVEVGVFSVNGQQADCTVTCGTPHEDSNKVGDPGT